MPDVLAHINAIEPPQRETIAFLYELFLRSNTEIAGHIKWNSPALYYSGEMQAFDARTYKRDLAVINLHRGKVLIIFPTGNKIAGQTGIGGKDYPDGRKIVTIENLEAARAKSGALAAAIKDWIAQIER